MSISNKDGSNYRLSGPNPITRSQDHWSDDETILVHNLLPEEVSAADSSYHLQQIPSPYDIVDLPFTAAAMLIKEEEEKPAVIEEESKPEEMMVTADKLLVAWCLLAEIKEQVNPLYGEISHVINYTDKFTFETVILRRGVLDCDMWSPTTTITRNSIIYLWNEREWWRVSDSQLHENGLILTCNPSEQHPSF